MVFPPFSLTLFTIVTVLHYVTTVVGKQPRSGTREEQVATMSENNDNDHVGDDSDVHFGEDIDEHVGEERRRRGWKRTQIRNERDMKQKRETTAVTTATVVVGD
ncbi:hypothetical protein A2U01_0004951 [Trifolium medium]|uniref:Secreted protein n=1 Tax=Trifolium medium TaxID=97028 RepID=A0A392M9F1_9FABA|nr:hypothetical protein [Trifolium medium]